MKNAEKCSHNWQIKEMFVCKGRHGMWEHEYFCDKEGCNKTFVGILFIHDKKMSKNGKIVKEI